MLYSLIVKHDQKLNPAEDPVSPALLFIQQSGAQGYDPTLKFGRDLIMDAATYEAEFMVGLSGLIAEIYDKTCPFASLCK